MWCHVCGIVIHLYKYDNTCSLFILFSPFRLLFQKDLIDELLLQIAILAEILVCIKMRSYTIEKLPNAGGFSPWKLRRLVLRELRSFYFFFSNQKIVFLYNKFVYASQNRSSQICMLIANKEGRRIAKCSKIYQNIHCSKCNVKKIRDIL